VKRTHRTHRTERVAAALLAGALWLVLVPAASAASELVLIPEIRTLVVLIIGFVILIPIVNNLIVKPVYAVLDERQEKIAGARKRAESLEASANDVLSRYQASVREVREEAERMRRGQLDAARSEHAQITGRARAEAEREIEQSQGELRASLEQARDGLRTSAEELARQAAERILGRAVS
jgi:F-type H+-transporting ATPase subunit b